MSTTSAYGTPQEMRDRSISQMGEKIGSLFYALWQEVAWLHSEWHEYIELFGTKPSRIALMNEAAPVFFRIVQDDLSDIIVLRIARLTDSPKSVGKSNLTVRQLPEKIDDNSLQRKVKDLVDIAVSAADSFRERRHRHIAHRDLDLSLGVTTDPLPKVTREKMEVAMKGLGDVLNVISDHYLKNRTDFASINNVGGAGKLVRVLHDGVQKKNERVAALRRGELPNDESYWLNL